VAIAILDPASCSGGATDAKLTLVALPVDTPSSPPLALSFQALEHPGNLVGASSFATDWLRISALSQIEWSGDPAGSGGRLHHLRRSETATATSNFE